MHNHYILTATNTPLVVTNLMAAGVINPAPSTLSGLPLGTAGNSASGEVLLKVSVREGGSSPAALQYQSNVQIVTADGSIPTGVLSWSVTNIDSTDFEIEGAALPANASVSGGGYGPSATSASALAYTLSNGSALVVFDEIS
jgi:hypothetical protein